MSCVSTIVVFSCFFCCVLTGDTSSCASVVIGCQEVKLPANTSGTTDGREVDEDSVLANSVWQVTTDERSSVAVEQWQRIAESRRLVIESKRLADRYPAESTNLAIQAANTTRDVGEPITTEARQQLYELTSRFGGRPLNNESPNCSPLILSNGTLIYALSHEAGFGVILEDLKTGQRQTLDYLSDEVRGGVYNLIVGPNEEWLIATGPRIIAWNLKAESVSQTRTQVSAEPWPKLVRFSKSGNFLMSLLDDGTAQKWAVSSNGFRPFPKVHDRRKKDVFLFSPDGNWLLGHPSIIGGCNVIIQNLNEPGEPETVKQFPGKHIDSAVISDDGQWIAVGGFGCCQLFQLDSTSSKWRSHDLFPPGVQHAATTAMDVIAFSPDSKYLVTSTQDRGEIWNLENAPDPEITLPVPVVAAYFTSTNRLVTLTPAHRNTWTSNLPMDRSIDSHGGVLRIWDYQRKGAEQAPSPVVTGSLMSIRHFKVSPDNKTIATIDSDQKIQLWNIGLHEIQGIDKAFRGHDEGILNCEFSCDSNYLITDANSQMSGGASTYTRASPARIWDLKNPTTNMMATSSRPGHQLFFSDQGWLVTRNGNSSTFVWHFASNKSRQIENVKAIDSRRWLVQRSKESSTILDLSKEFPFDNPFVITGGFHDFAITLDKSLLAIKELQSEGANIKVIDLSKPPQQQVPRTLVTGLKGSSNIRLSESARWLTIDTGNDGLRLYDLFSSDARSSHLQKRQRESFDDLYFAGDDRWLINRWADQVVIRDLGSDEIEDSEVVIPNHRILALSKRHGLLLTMANDYGMYFWNLNDPGFQSRGKRLLTQKLKREPDFTEFNEAGTRLVANCTFVPETGSIDRCLVWEIDSSEIDPTPREFEIERPASTVLSRDGNRLAYHQNSNTVLLLNLETTSPNDPLTMIPTAQSGIYNLEISADGRWLAADGNAPLLWDLNASDIPTSRIELPTGSSERETFRVVFSDDARLITVLTDSGRVYVWNLGEDDLISSAMKLIEQH